MSMQSQAIYVFNEKNHQPGDYSRKNVPVASRMASRTQPSCSPTHHNDEEHDSVLQWVLNESQRTWHQTGKALLRGKEMIYDELLKDINGIGKPSQQSMKDDEPQIEAPGSSTTPADTAAVATTKDHLVYMPGWSQDITLNDGTIATVRPLGPQDKERLINGFEQLSSTSRYQRFMTTMQKLPDSYVEYLTDIDYLEHFAIAAAIEDPARFDVHGLGIARFIALPDSDREAELAITIIDEVQGQGLGVQLMEILLRAAAERGYKALRAEVLPTNEGMQHLAKRFGGERVALSEGLASWRIPITDTVDAKDRA